LNRDRSIATYKDATYFELFRFATRSESRKRRLWHPEINHGLILP
jgi:hypothetical protein